MTALITGVVLFAAFLHASWNAILKSSSGDRLWAMVVVCATATVFALPLVLILPPPAPVSWPYIALSAAVQDLSCLLIVQAYRDGALAQVYPIARGSSPMLVTLGAVVAAGEHPPLGVLTGVGLVCAAILVLGLEKARPSGRTLAAALAVGATISVYTLSDGLGARLSGASFSYTAWLFLIQGASMPLLFAVIRRGRPPAWRNVETARAVAGGVFGMVSYGVVVWALARAPMGRVSALRESSVLFAVLIGAVFLGEKPTRSRWIAAVMIAGGAALLATTR